MLYRPPPRPVLRILSTLLKVMPISLRNRVSLLLLSSLLAGISTACSSLSSQSSSSVDPATASAPVSSPAPVSAVAVPSPAPTPQPQPDPFQQAVNRATSAANIVQSAQSRDDWRLVASRWQQALDLMAQVPTASPHHALAQQKLVEYRRNLSYAEQQANRPAAPASSGVVAIAPHSNTSQVSVPSSSPPASVSAPPIVSAPSSNGVYQAPIVRRAGGTPVISVMFNGSRRYDMIVDTGASGTLITQAMASSLGLVPVGQTRVDTASARSVAFPLGYVSSMQVDQIVANNVLVAVAGPDLDLGLLGHDFFGNYDVTIRQNVVEFRER